MRLVLRALQLHLPAAVRNRILDEVFKCTAAAFGAAVPQVRGLTHGERLRRYALFTRELAEEAFRDGERSTEVRARLFHHAHGLGEKLKRQLGVGGLAEVMAAGSVLYRALGIEFRATAQDEVVIPRCFFSRYYTSDICRLVSALDEGVVAGMSEGLSEGGRLVFGQRLTDGYPCCKAHLVREGEA